MSPEHCLEILKKDLAKDDIECAAIGATSSAEYKQMLSLIAQLSSLDSWGNARDVKTLGKQMVRLAFKRAVDITKATKLPLSGLDAICCIAGMLDERVALATNLPSASIPRSALPAQHLDPPKADAYEILNACATRAATWIPKLATRYEEAFPSSQGRDPGVPDVVWKQLEVDKWAALEAAHRQKEELDALEEAVRDAYRAEEAQKALETDLVCRAREASADAEIKCQLEEQRLKRVTAIAVRQAKEKKLEAHRQKELEEAQKEQRAQTKLRQMGVCAAGYEWIKQADGYDSDFMQLHSANVALARSGQVVGSGCASPTP
ncbi:uncharacterized protein PHACADRAFT_202920 [Phanerochaete carnosa HHB-10118-sp]|uniref:Uncharacterized protein n=1 Tax=Phanerochaete carnosa (strain HHB-10118-sp) TaxID=650164 RepID=K5VP76_PHACS|nr:uncharacterized protein PHACADRAFT_202920 [Phanerochaete carnosa HHB-10118-sp]EKM48359.1 hypothetical protein PHACADRAFT_202920 [Phanerochaete carnosa HHB-10118-sp]